MFAKFKNSQMLLVTLSRKFILNLQLNSLNWLEGPLINRRYFYFLAFHSLIFLITEIRERI